MCCDVIVVCVNRTMTKVNSVLGFWTQSTGVLRYVMLLSLYDFKHKELSVLTEKPRDAIRRFENLSS